MDEPDRAGMDVNHERSVPGERPGRVGNEDLKIILEMILLSLKISRESAPRLGGSVC